jgi:NAD(P)-dependent dehydrogenase (short-subunit alcohol dehydrogenase family)
MRIKLERLRDQVIVITGASSGIGLTTAEMAARQGARVVLNARNAADLQQAADHICHRGGRAIAVPGDVADDEAMDRLAQRAIEAFGAIDTWVNNAGIGMYGRL